MFVDNSHYNVTSVSNSEGVAEMSNSYTMGNAMHVGNRGILFADQYMRGDPETLDVVSVEKDKTYQTKDIDLLWYKLNGVIIPVEVKGDRYHRTGNYFIETVSNTTKNTPGCFVYTEAELFFYIFIFSREVCVVPVEKARAYLAERTNNFADTGPYRQVETATKDKKGTILYKTRGLLVAREELDAAVGVNVKQMPSLAS
jgi:hypothetical protein